MNNIYDNVVKMMLEQYKDKIVIGESLEQYLNSFTKERLIAKLGICCGCDDNEDISKILLLNMKSKKDVIDYITENINSLYFGLFEYVDSRFFDYFKILINNNGYMKVNAGDFKWSISFILLLNRLLLAKINYNARSNEVEIYMPKEIMSAVKILVINKNIIKKNKKNNEIIYDIECMLDTYGLMDFESLYNIYNKVFGNINKNKLESIIYIYSYLSDGVNVFGDNELKLVCGVNFDNEDDAFSYYYATEGEYKLFTKEEYYAIWDKSYIKKVDGYSELFTYLIDTFEMNIEDIDDFCDSVLVDYLYSCMEDGEIANKNLMVHLDEFFDGITIQDKVKIRKLFENIYRNYPNWEERGYSIVEKERIKL